MCPFFSVKLCKFEESFKEKQPNGKFTMKIRDIWGWVVFCNDIEAFLEFLAIEQGEHWLKTTNVIAFDFGKNDMKVVMYNKNINQKCQLVQFVNNFFLI